MHNLRRHALVPIALALALLVPVGRAAAGSAPEGRFVIHILTVDPGEELFMRFGHIAVVVEDRRERTKRVYNFGTYDFENPDLRFQYARGFLTYWLSVVSYAEMVRWYKEDHRGMTLRTLNLTPEQAAQTARLLRVNARPENAEYDYRHYLDNCCTRIRDLLNSVLGGGIEKKYKGRPTERTFRYWTRRALRGMPLYKNVILFSLGPAIDQPITRWDEEFLPEVFVEDLDELTVGADHAPLVLKTQRVFDAKGPRVGTVTYSLDVIVTVVLFGLLILGFGLPLVLKRRKLSRRLIGVGLLTWGLLAGLAGTMLVLYWTVTTHYDTHYNENLLVMPPLSLWLIGPGAKLIVTARLSAWTFRALKYYLVGALTLIALDLLLKLGPFIQGNLEFVVFALLCDAAAFFALRRHGAPETRARQRKRR